MKNTSKMIALLLVVAMMVTALAGCGKKIDVDQYQAPAATQAPAASAAPAAEAAPAPCCAWPPATTPPRPA